MNKYIMFASAAILSAGIVFVSNGVGAQGMPQTVELAKVDVQKLAAGYRASKGDWQQRRERRERSHR
jgi:hypothetical protein